MPQAPVHPRARIVSYDATHCSVVTWDDVLCRQVCRDYWTALPSGGYVRTGQAGRQVCAGLAEGGPTLTWHPSPRFPRLVDLVRHERRQALRQDRRRMARL
jgi:hypothetical protein